MAVITSAPFGVTADGRQVTVYKMKNKNGAEIWVSDFGACITRLFMPDREGRLADLALGFDSPAGYEKTSFAPCATVGRYANRIAKGRFCIDGKEYQATCNDGENLLHGGTVGFDLCHWDGVAADGKTGPYLRFSRLSPDGEEGFPGNLKIQIFFFLTDENEIIIQFHAVCDQDTLCNPATHLAINLDGHNAGSCLAHEVKIESDYYAKADKGGIPLGTRSRVDGTPMDFTQFHPLGERILADFEPLLCAGGYDHNWFLNRKPDDQMGLCLTARAPGSGRVMRVYTDMPCLQMYTANFLCGKEMGKGGFAYPKYAALFMETQFAPDSPNHPDWASPILRANQPYFHTTAYQFGIY